MSAKVFISYRREDSPAMAGRIADRLKLDFGSDAIFMDVDDIPAGEDFRAHIDRTLKNCGAVLVVIGPKWLSASRNEKPRLEEPGDFVRLEAESALQLGVPVVPVLVGDTQMPERQALPESMRKLSDHNAVRVDEGADFHLHMDRLCRAVGKVCGAPSGRKGRRSRSSRTGGRGLILVVAGIVGLVLAVGWKWLDGRVALPSAGRANEVEGLFLFQGRKRIPLPYETVGGRL